MKATDQSPRSGSDRCPGRFQQRRSTSAISLSISASNHEACGVRMKETVSPNSSWPSSAIARETVEKALPFGGDICSASSARPAVGARRGEIESISTRRRAPCAFRAPASALRGIKHIGPFGRIMKKAKSTPPISQGLARQVLRRDRQVFRHEANRPELNATIAGACIHRAPASMGDCIRSSAIPRPRNSAFPILIVINSSDLKFKR